jgi:hypothetical protein
MCRGYHWAERTNGPVGAVRALGSNTEARTRNIAARHIWSVPRYIGDRP